MIVGRVNAYREAVISLSVEGSGGRRREIDAVVDTGFNGYLTLPATLIQELGRKRPPNPTPAAGDGIARLRSRHAGDPVRPLRPCGGHRPERAQ